MFSNVLTDGWHFHIKKLRHSLPALSLVVFILTHHLNPILFIF